MPYKASPIFNVKGQGIANFAKDIEAAIEIFIQSHVNAEVVAVMPVTETDGKTVGAIVVYRSKIAG